MAPTNSLSDVFPPNTTYFYGFPSQWDSGFYNECPPAIEELVAMRAVACAGDTIRVVTFASTCQPHVWECLRNDVGVPLPSRDQLIILPDSIHAGVVAPHRNNHIKQALSASVPNGTLVMAQPYIDTRLEKKYQINPAITTWLNDKDSIEELVPEEHRVPELARVENGQDLPILSPDQLSYPCVVKISASSSGNGVAVCRSPQDFRRAQECFQNIPGTILIQKKIDARKELDVKFVIHPDSTRPFELLGHSDEISAPSRDYLGGIIHAPTPDERILPDIEQTLLTTILPKIRSKGWYGVGGVDVLIDTQGHYYFIDFNCRMTATMAQTLQTKQGFFPGRSILAFTGTFSGTFDEFRKHILPLAQHQDPHQQLNVVALADDGRSVRLNGGILFEGDQQLRRTIEILEQKGIESEMFAHHFKDSPPKRWLCYRH